MATRIKCRGKAVGGTQRSSGNTVTGNKPEGIFRHSVIDTVCTEVIAAVDLGNCAKVQRTVEARGIDEA